MANRDGREIMVWGTGEEERDLLYVSDLVNFVELAVNKQDSKYKLYNVGYGSSVSVNELVKEIITAAHKDLKINHDLTKPSIKTKLCLDTTKARTALGWAPVVSLNEGIKKSRKMTEK